ncbi:hypothetical protein HD554DRAFT_2034503 [Boletus coccyginus]|nr:hypothetical protein HD554DRAFT_2034503 [Boletus coccyginus]
MSFRTPRASKSPTSNSNSDSDSVDSLFDEPSTMSIPLAMRSVPPIPGLFVPPVSIPTELATQIAHECMRLYFDGRDVNQIMLFGRTTTAMGEEEEGTDARMGKGLPSILIQLLHQLSALLHPWIPSDLHDHLFPSKGAPSRARQAILNLYHPGEGITPHVDLLNRFDDGIIGVSLCGSCVMSFEEAAARGSAESGGEGKKWDLYLPERSVLVMSKDARYDWKHGIPGRTHDLVENEDEYHEPCLIKRGIRLSATFRWLLPGADIVGGPET